MLALWSSFDLPTKDGKVLFALERLAPFGWLLAACQPILPSKPLAVSPASSAHFIVAGSSPACSEMAVLWPG